MSLEKYLNRVLSECTETEVDDDFSAVEIYEDGDTNDEDEWDERIHSTMGEAVKKVRLVRNGLLTRIARSTKPGYKIAHGEERRMSFSERRARQRAAERTYAKRKKHMSDKLQGQRKESIEKRKDYGLDAEEE